MSDLIDDKPAAAPVKKKEREERPKYSLSEDLDYRIKGLESAKMEPNMTQADIAALERALVKLREKKAEKELRTENSNQ